jgi:hypothetical protein
MTRLEIVLSAVLFISIVFNIGIVAYARATALRLLSISEELGDLQQMITTFCIHLKSVYELDTFYGDTTLSGLLDHARSFNELMETFEHVYSLTVEEDISEDGEITPESETQSA